MVLESLLSTHQRFPMKYVDSVKLVFSIGKPFLGKLSTCLKVTAWVGDLASVVLDEC